MGAGAGLTLPFCGRAVQAPGGRTGEYDVGPEGLTLE